MRHATAMALLLCGLFALPAAAEERARMLARADAAAETEFDVFVPPAPDPELGALITRQTNPTSPNYHRWLTPSEYRSRFGTDPAALEEVAAELRSAGLTVESVHAHSLHVRGLVAQVERRFATHLATGVFRTGRARLVAESDLTLPDALARRGALIPAFSPVIRARKHSRVAGPVQADSRSGGTGPYWFTDLRQAYDLPDVRVLDGTGVTIGILMSGDYNPPDMRAYFGHEKAPVPRIDTVQVNGGSPFSTLDSIETHLDIQQAGGMAPGARIVLYDIPDLADASILAGLSAIDEANRVDIVNMSFGAPEIAYSAAYNNGQDFRGLLAVVDALLKQGNAQGITFVTSSGDAGALDAVPLACLNGLPACGFYGLSVDHPASSQYATSVGGTNLVTTATKGSRDARYVRENAYFDRLTSDVYYDTAAQGAIWGSGGGISSFEGRPWWQGGVATGSTRHRAVPDVAGHMGGCIRDTILPCAPERSADVVAIGGRFIAVHGTSASSPDFAGILALKAQLLNSRLGNVNPELYRLGRAQRAHTIAQVFRDDIPGSNGYYPSTHGYNLVLGNGTVRGRAFIGVPFAPAAGTPQTPSNP